MRNVIVSNMVSLDGFAGNDDDSVNELPIGPDVDDFHRYNVERLRAASTLLSGSRSYQTFEGFWPPLEADPSASDLHREISRLNNRAEKVVIADSYTVPDDSPWRSSTTVVPRADAAESVEQMKRARGADILIFGSPTTWNALLGAGVIDELHLMVAPVLIGSGIRTFRRGLPDDLSLLESRHIGDAGSVVLRYRVSR